MENKIEQGIRETLVVENPKGIKYAVDKIMKILADEKAAENKCKCDVFIGRDHWGNCLICYKKL